MKTLEAGGNVDPQGTLSLDKPVLEIAQQRVRAIILVQDTLEGSEFNPSDPPNRCN